MAKRIKRQHKDTPKKRICQADCPPAYHRTYTDIQLLTGIFKIRKNTENKGKIRDFCIDGCPLVLEVLSCVIGGMYTDIGGRVPKYWRISDCANLCMSFRIGGESECRPNCTFSGDCVYFAGICFGRNGRCAVLSNSLKKHNADAQAMRYDRTNSRVI